MDMPNEEEGCITAEGDGTNECIPFWVQQMAYEKGLGMSVYRQEQDYAIIQPECVSLKNTMSSVRPFQVYVPKFETLVYVKRNAPSHRISQAGFLT